MPVAPPGLSTAGLVSPRATMLVVPMSVTVMASVTQVGVIPGVPRAVATVPTVPPVKVGMAAGHQQHSGQEAKNLD